MVQLARAVNEDYTDDYGLLGCDTVSLLITGTKIYVI
jgi:hypothetical protein